MQAPRRKFIEQEGASVHKTQDHPRRTGRVCAEASVWRAGCTRPSRGCSRGGARGPAPPAIQLAQLYVISMCSAYFDQISIIQRFYHSKGDSVAHPAELHALLESSPAVKKLQDKVRHGVGCVTEWLSLVDGWL